MLSLRAPAVPSPSVAYNPQFMLFVLTFERLQLLQAQQLFAASEPQMIRFPRQRRIRALYAPLFWLQWRALKTGYLQVHEGSMQTLKSSSADALTLENTRTLPAAFSARWVLRRAGLWLLFVGLGIAGSCLLYMAASRAEGESHAPAAPASISAKM